mmetsp:Transcript_126059/g.218441  ORF Transcript_126059/g.218441 Transcript_126059/m.218441 type:complete len:694 (+) Transcript_126059:107-2188(+)
MFRILLLVLEFLSCKSHRFVTSSSIQTGSGVLQPGMKLDEFVLIERLHSWSSDKQSQSSGSDASWIAANSSALELVQTMPTGLLQMKSSEDLPANVTNSIGSKYKVLKRLASGSFGEVWKAVGPDTKTVVIKLFYTEGDNGECNEVKQLIEDAEAKSHSARLYIAKCLESRLSSEPNKIGYVVQEYGGRPLFELGLENRTALQVLRDAREILFQLLSVLDLLESRGLSHHDLTPANIVYKRIEETRDERHGDSRHDGSILIKVVDWGALVNEAHVTVSESCPWTPAYQPPEHREDEKCYTKGMIAKYDIYAAGLVYAVALLLAKTPPMTEAEVSSARSRIEGIWTKSEVKNVSRLFGPPPSSDTQQQDGLEEDISQQTGEEAAESNWAEVVLEVQEPNMLDKMKARTKEALVRAGKKATGRKYAVGDSNLAGALQMGREHKLAVAEPHAQRLSSLVEAFKRFAEEHQLEFPTADAQLLSRLTSANPKDRPTALQAAVEVNGFEEPGIASWNIGSFGCENFQDRVQQFVRQLTSESGISELASCDYESETKTHRKYNIERTDFTRGEVKLTIFNKGGHKWPMLEDGKIDTREWEQKGEGIPFSLQKCILDTVRATTHNFHHEWCCRSEYKYEHRSGYSLTGSKYEQPMNITFCMDAKSLDVSEPNPVLYFKESGPKVNSSKHIVDKAMFSNSVC